MLKEHLQETQGRSESQEGVSSGHASQVVRVSKGDEKNCGPSVRGSGANILIPSTYLKTDPY